MESWTRLALESWMLWAPLVALAVLLGRFVGCAEIAGIDDWTGAPTVPYSDRIKAEPSLVAYWRLGETSGPTAVDQVGPPGPPPGRNPGQYTSVEGGLVEFDTPTIQSAAALGTFEVGHQGLLTSDAGTATYFNGGFVEIDHNAVLNPPTFSVEAWVHPAWAEVEAKFHAVVTSREDVNGQKRGYILYAGPDLDDPGDPKAYWQAWVGNGGAQWVRLVGPEAKADSTVHVAMTYDGATLKLFVDGGVQVNETLEPNGQTDVSPAYVANAGAPLYIGLGSTEAPPPPNTNLTPYFPFQGRIQEVAIYQSADINVPLHTAAGNGLLGA